MEYHYCNKEMNSSDVNLDCLMMDLRVPVAISS